jgi:small-conductance mechanosensitive channel
MAEFFDPYSIQLLETVIAIVAWMVVRVLLRMVVTQRLKKTDFRESRKRIALKSIFGIANLLFFSVLVTIWSVDQREILVFLSSIVTILGVAFFAQWSHLSNITSGIIIFFNTATKIGDEIKIMDKDVEIEGEIFDIGLMFFKIRTQDDEIISIPNNMVLQKAIKTNDPRLKAQLKDFEEVTNDD